MKKFFAFALFAAALAAGIFGQSIPKGSKVMVVSQSGNLSGTEASWLPGAVRDKLESNLQTYTDFSFVAADPSAVLKLQKQSGGAAYSESDAIELGKMSVAKYAVFVTLRKSGGYTAVADVTDLTTGQKLATAISGERKTANELFSAVGCAADELTIALCDKLKIALSNTQRYSLMHGEQETVSDEERLRQARQEEAAFAKQMKGFDEQIKSLKSSTKTDASAEAAKLEAQRALAEEKLRAAKAQTARLEEDAKKRAADAKLDAQRSEEQKRRRDEMARQAAEKAQEVRKSIMSSASIFEQINIIEQKKKAVVEIRNSANARVRESDAILDKEMNAKIPEIQKRPYKTVDKDANGNVTAAARKERENEIEYLKRNYNSKKKDAADNIREIAKEQQYPLLKEIFADYVVVGKTRTASSLGKDLRCAIGVYDGNKNAWNATLYFYIDGIPISNQSISLRYSDLTGESVPNRNSSAFDRYAENVDMYNSLFRRGDPILTFELDYQIQPKDEKYPSQYNINFLDFRVKDTASGRILGRPSLAVATVTRAMAPAYNISQEYLAAEGKLEKDLAGVRKEAEQQRQEEKRKAAGQEYLIKEAARKLGFTGGDLANYLQKTEERTLKGSFIIPEGFRWIEHGAFKNQKSLTSVTIPNSVTEIKWNAFEGCTSLASVTIPNSVTEIGSEAFSGCTSLASVIIENGVVTIGNQAFSGCKSLERITIPGSVNEIGTYAFGASLKNVIIENGVTKIGFKAFAGCTSLESVTIPSSVTEIEIHAFDYHPNLVIKATEGSYAFNYAKEHYIKYEAILSQEEKEKILVSKEITRKYIEVYCEQNKIAPKDLAEFTIPSSITKIEEGAFKGCTSLASITIPNSVTEIKWNAFEGCTSLASVTIPNSVTEIGSEAFSGCTSLASVTIPNSVTEIRKKTFSGCTSLASITIPGSVTSIGDAAFIGCTSLASVTMMPNSVTYGGTDIGEDAFSGCTSLKSVTMPSSIRSVASRAFKGCKSLESITIPKRVDFIAVWAFSETALKSAVFEDPKGWIIEDWDDKKGKPIKKRKLKPEELKNPAIAAELLKKLCMFEK